MQNSYNIWKFEEWLAKPGVDRYIHLLVGLILGFVIGILIGTPILKAGLISTLIVFILGFIKEIIDSTMGEKGDIVDWLFTTIGGIISFGLLMLTQLL